MKKVIIVVCVIVIVTTFTKCYRDFSGTPIPIQDRELTFLEKKLVESDEKFGLKLFREIVKSSPDSNIFISPLSVSMALAMTYNGADGTTEQAMRNTLELGDLTKIQINESCKSLIELCSEIDPQVKFQIANSIWYKQGFIVEQDFIKTNQRYFDAIVTELDFAAPGGVDIINSWISEHTNHKIENIIDQIPPLTVMYLINAIYFNGTWMYEFDKNLTKDDLFETPSGTQVSIKMMQISGDFFYYENDNFQAIDLMYGSGKYGMTIFLPKQTKSLDSLINQLDPLKFHEWISYFSEYRGNLSLPKMKIEYKIKLNDILTSLGMGIAFDALSANFENISKNSRGNLYISRVLHNTFLQVNEEGTEAAAATVVEIKERGVEPSGFVMKINRPFFFFIRERNSNVVLFIGKIVNPTI